MIVGFDAIHQDFTGFLITGCSEWMKTLPLIPFAGIRKPAVTCKLMEENAGKAARWITLPDYMIVFI